MSLPAGRTPISGLASDGNSRAGVGGGSQWPLLRSAGFRSGRRPGAQAAATTASGVAARCVDRAQPAEAWIVAGDHNANDHASCRSASAVRTSAMTGTACPPVSNWNPRNKSAFRSRSGRRCRQRRAWIARRPRRRTVTRVQRPMRHRPEGSRFESRRNRLNPMNGAQTLFPLTRSSCQSTLLGGEYSTRRSDSLHRKSGCNPEPGANGPRVRRGLRFIVGDLKQGVTNLIDIRQRNPASCRIFCRLAG